MKTARTSTVVKLFVAGAIVLAGAAGAGIAPRLKQREALARTQSELAGPRRVRTAKVRAGEPVVDVTLPGTSAPFQSALLYGKSTGFVRKNLVDVGDKVTRGQLLAQIAAPETAQEIRVAQARLDEAEANVGVVLATAERTSKLVHSGALPPQQADDAKAQANSAVTSIATRRAELSRLQVLHGYQQIVAPFDGVITRRNVDPGALVGPASTGGVALFEIADVEMLRVFVDVPDAFARDVTPGLDAEIYAPRDPSQKVKGKVARTSGVLEQATRTLRAEVHVKASSAAMPGSFVYVKLGVPRARPRPVIPASALVVRKEGTLVARVRDHQIGLVRVALGRDFGKELEVLDGLEPGDDVVINASDTLNDGERVEVVSEA